MVVAGISRFIVCAKTSSLSGYARLFFSLAAIGISECFAPMSILFLLTNIEDFLSELRWGALFVKLACYPH